MSNFYYENHGVRLFCGDSLAVLKTLPDASVNCVVTSPPYWGLRDYGVEGQIGLEESPAAYVGKMVGLFAEVRRVLRDDGVAWLNLGDSYAGSGKGAWDNKDGGQKEVYIPDSDSPQTKLSKSPNAFRPGSGRADGVVDERAQRNRDGVGGVEKIQPKNLIGIPWRTAFALQDDGWYLRSDIIWAKPNPMPESVMDRPTRAHEYIFLLTKSKRYWYDANAVKLAAKNPQDDERRLAAAAHGHKSNPDEKKNGLRPFGSTITGGLYGRPHLGDAIPEGERRDEHPKQRFSDGQKTKDFDARWDAERKAKSSGSNLRDVWWMAPAQFKEAHFATFPMELPLLCIKAGCPPGGVVLDPFAGAGTTLMAARELDRQSIGVELNPSYCEIARERLEKSWTPFRQASLFDESPTPPPI